MKPNLAERVGMIRLIAQQLAKNGHTGSLRVTFPGEEAPVVLSLGDVAAAPRVEKSVAPSTEMSLDAQSIIAELADGLRAERSKEQKEVKEKMDSIEQLLREVIAGQKLVVETLNLPVVPQYNLHGRVVSAKRVPKEPK